MKCDCFSATYAAGWGTCKPAMRACLMLTNLEKATCPDRPDLHRSAAPTGYISLRSLKLAWQKYCIAQGWFAHVVKKKKENKFLTSVPESPALEQISK